MTQKLRQFTGRELIAILRRHGFEIDRQSGSHVIMIHGDGRRVTVPVHAGRTLGKGLLRSLMADARLTPEDLEAQARARGRSGRMAASYASMLATS